MAGTREVTETYYVDGTTVTAVWSHTYDDTWDGYEWGTKPNGAGFRDSSALDLTGNVTITIEGAGSVLLEYYRMQGQSPNVWRSGTFTAVDSPLSYPLGSGPNPRTVGDMVGGRVTAVG